MAYQGGKLSDGTPLNVAVYKAYRNAGLSHNQALAITAEVGRENSFRSDILFGNHTDPARDKNGKKIRNLGMLSWNQGRDNLLEGYLNKNGVMQNGVMAKNQANLNAQAQFSVREMKSKRYAGGLKNFLNNPNANPDTYARELGKKYVVWAYGQNDIKGKVAGTREPFDWKANDNRRRGYLNTLGGMLGDKKSYQAQSQQQTPIKMFQPPPMLEPSEQAIKRFEPPPLLDSIEDASPPIKTFQPPPMIDAVNTPQKTFQPPPLLDLADIEGATDQQTMNDNAMPELEPQEWQT